MKRPMKPIPIKAAEIVAENYGYDQVIILARRVGEEPDPYGEHVTTYGRNKTHCEVAARVGNYLKHKIMGWPCRKVDTSEPLYRALRKLHQEAEDQRTRLGDDLPETGRGRELHDEVVAAIKLHEEAFA